MITDRVAELRRHWEDGFNQYDVDLVMEPIDQDIVFSSPFVQRRTGAPATVTIEGYDAFRDANTPQEWLGHDVCGVPTPALARAPGRAGKGRSA